MKITTSNTAYIVSFANWKINDRHTAAKYI